MNFADGDSSCVKTEMICSTISRGRSKREGIINEK